MYANKELLTLKQMKFILFITFSVLFFSLSLASDYFPISKYSYAKVYLFNINLENSVEKPNNHIYNGEYAISKLGNGYKLSNENLTQILRTINHFYQEMHNGLSKCFIPRHGIIFYNDKHIPVASLSICFECEQISTWDIDTLYHPNIKDIHFTSKTITATERGFSLLKRIFIKSGVPVYENSKQYSETMPNEEQIKPIPMKKMPFTTRPVNFEDIKSWNSAKSFKEDNESKITAGGDKYEFKTLTYKKSKFLFIDNESNPKLAEASIVDPGIKTILNLQIGMSLEEVNQQTKLELNSNYNQFKIDAEDIRLILTFKNQTLTKIQLNQY